MKLLLVRDKSTDNSTTGKLFVNDVFQCFTLEDVVRPIKISGCTAIPAGSYEVIMTFSNRFQKVMPLLVNVPYFEGVRIHAGNTSKDTEGCILVGSSVETDFIGGSRVALAKLMTLLKASKDRVVITVENAK